jgi:Uma2 family endonuclease
MATVEDTLVDELYRTPEKAEIVHGRVVKMSPASDEHGQSSLKTTVNLREYARRTGIGRAVGDNDGFLCNLPHRKSFSPDAAYYTGPRGKRKFYPQAPDFAVEIRSEDDYGPAGEREMSEKRSAYFAAGTKVVWDVDLHSDDVVRVYRSTAPENPTIYGRGQAAEAEPAVPGWSMPVDALFEE